MVTSTGNKITLMKTPIIYYGGKTSMLKIILPMIPAHEVYTEPFFGGGTIFFAKKPCKIEVINDRLSIVINFYRQLKENYSELKTLIDKTLFAQQDYDKAKVIMRNHNLFSPVENAWALWISTNIAKGQNLTHGSIKTTNGNSGNMAATFQKKKDSFTTELAKRLELTTIDNRDALYVLKRHNVAKAFHYLDPPYPNASQGHYRGYTFADLQQLLTWCETCKGKFLLSNYNSEMLDDFVKRNNWIKTEHAIANKGLRKNDAKKLEVLVRNYELPNKPLF